MSTSRSIKSKLADSSSSYDNMGSTSCEALLVPPSFILDVNSSPSPTKSKNLSLHPLHFWMTHWENLWEEILEAYYEYTSTLSNTRSPTLSPASITHISETELHDETDFSLTSSSDTDIKWQNVTTRKKKSPCPKKSSCCNTSKNVSNITHISESSEFVSCLLFR